MVNRLEIRDLPETGQLQLRLIDGEDTVEAPPVNFPDPLGPGEQAEFSWYLQEYLDSPFGLARERGQAVEAALRNLGRLMFEAVFVSDEARDILGVAVEQGFTEFRLAIVSDRAEFLSLPWELLNSPDAGYVAASAGSVVREADPGALPTFVADLAEDQLNVLVVSPCYQQAESNGAEGNQGGKLAAGLVAVLESLDVQVELDFLRPPTRTDFAASLADRAGRYHIVHFDGIWLNEAGDVLLESDSRRSGAGRSEAVEPGELASVLVGAGVPLAVFSAGDRGPRAQECSSGWLRLGRQITEAGIPAALVMPYALRGSAVVEGFLRRLYQSLVQGNDVASAVAAARTGLMAEPRRTTLAGPQVSWDWITPTLYLSREYSPPTIQAEQSSPLGVPTIQAQDTPAESQFPAAGQYGLLGRQAELAGLERMLASEPVVLLTGNTGVGKTELGLGLARWVQKTGSNERPGGVFYTPFELAHSASLERVIHEIGTSILGLRFADLSQERQRSWVVEYLKEQPSLLILDGVENIAGFPSGSPGLLEEAEREALGQFIADVAGPGASQVLLTSRNRSEEWLTCPYSRFTLGGLDIYDRRELAAAALARANVEPDRVSEDVVQLLDMIEGHPLALQVALPLLKETPASVIIGELQRALDQFSDAVVEEGRDNFLTALMEYSWSKMSHRSRTHLPFLALFHRRVMMDILTHITQEQAYRSALGEELGWGACRTLLRSAMASGFLEPISPSVFQVHPAVPRFLGSKLGRQLRGDAIGRLESEFVRVYADTADYFMESLYENQDSGATAVLAEEGNLNQALGLALEARQWESAQLIVQPLAQVYRMQRRIPELRRLRGQLLEAVGTSSAEADAAGGIDLWLYLLGTDVSEAVEQGDVQRAYDLNQQLSDYLAELPDAETDPRLASVYHQFGAIALLLRRLDEAAGWFQRSLDIIESTDDRPAVADDYFALGQVRQFQRLYTEAKEWYGKALDIHQRLPDEEEMVKDFRALGMVTQLKFEHKEAESWYHRARDMVEEHRDEETAVLVFHELGTVCHAQYNFDEAKIWYQQALSLSDRLGNQPQMATELHFLGLLEQDRGIVYEEAEEWYLAALERKEELGDRRGAGDECRQLGVLFHEQKKYDEAASWYHQARDIFEELGDVQRIARTYGQLGMVSEERGDLSGALEWTARTYQLVTEYELPVLIQVKAHLARLREKYGEAEFADWWLNFTGDEAPTDLEVDTSGIL
ncbi:MAG: tetratricopeptide repeat protein [Chloroflexi bacterium]|nr:tetratricopeptide repeat protein [Chloroflexota bacterium]